MKLKTLLMTLVLSTVCLAGNAQAHYARLIDTQALSGGKILCIYEHGKDVFTRTARGSYCKYSLRVH